MKVKREEEGAQYRSGVDWKVGFETGRGRAGATREGQVVESRAWEQADTKALA